MYKYGEWRKWHLCFLLHASTFLQTKGSRPVCSRSCSLGATTTRPLRGVRSTANAASSALDAHGRHREADSVSCHQGTRARAPAYSLSSLEIPYPQAPPRLDRGRGPEACAHRRTTPSSLQRRVLLVEYHLTTHAFAFSASPTSIRDIPASVGSFDLPLPSGRLSFPSLLTYARLFCRGLKQES